MPFPPLWVPISCVAFCKSTWRITMKGRIMCILQPRSLLLAWGAVAASALAAQFAAAQGMARPARPAGPAMGGMSRPLTNPNAAMMGSPGVFRSLPFGMMAYPGMSAASSYGAGSRGYMSGMGGYAGGMSGTSYGAQGGQYGAGSYGYGGNTVTSSGTSSRADSLGRVLTAAGVPNDGGQLRWPVGLRVVGGPKSDELRQQIEALFQYAAQQTQAGPVSPHLVQELSRSVAALRTVLLRDRDERFSLALTTYEDAERFLTKLDHARKLFETDSEPPAGKGR
jgi:hypothetical protein